jgi:uncharacterized protein YggE
MLPKAPSLAALLLSVALLPSAPGAAPRTLNVSGSAEIRAFPDQADVILEVEAVRPKVKASLDRVQAAIRGAFAICARYASDSGDVTAGQIAVDKDYRWVKNTETFMGYRASQTLTLRLKDLRRLGELMEEVSAVKITRINGVYYSHSAMDSLERAAEAKALANARRSAETLAQGAGGSAGDALWIGNYRPPESGAAEGFQALGGFLDRGAAPSKAKAEYLVKPDMLTVPGVVYAMYELRPAKVPQSPKP